MLFVFVTFCHLLSFELLACEPLFSNRLCSTKSDSFFFQLARVGNCIESEQIKNDCWIYFNLISCLIKATSKYLEGNINHFVPQPNLNAFPRKPANKDRETVELIPIRLDL